MRYEDFTVLFTANEGQYIVRVIESPAGEVIGEFTPPFSGEDASQIFSSLRRSQQPLRHVRPVGIGESASAVSSLEELGGALFDSLFSGEVGNLFQRCLGSISARTGCGLRIKLRLNPMEFGLAAIYSLPWEFLYAAETRSFLALSRITSIVRYLDVPRPAVSVPLPSTLRVLVVIPNPGDTAPLDLERESNLVEEAFRGAGRSIDLEIMEQATVASVQEALRNKPYHILHFSGHGHLGRSGEAGLIFEDESGKASFIGATLLATVLTDSASLRLVFVNACESSRIVEADVFSSVASSLVFGGVPAVVANQYPISDRGAIVFSQRFYRLLAGGSSLDEAIAEGRLGIRHESPDAIEWGIPSLFSRLPENALFSERQRSTGDNGSLRAAAAKAVRSVTTEKSKPEVQAEPADNERSVEDDGIVINQVGEVTSVNVFDYKDAFSPVKESTAFVLRELEAGHQQARAEAEMWSKASLRAAGLGLLLVIVTVGMLLVERIDAGIISAISSFLTTSISALFFMQSRAANRRMDAGLRELSLARDVHLASEIASTLSTEEEKDKLKAMIVQKVLQNADRRELFKETAEHEGQADG